VAATSRCGQLFRRRQAHRWRRRLVLVSGEPRRWQTSLRRALPSRAARRRGRPPACAGTARVHRPLALGAVLRAAIKRWERNDWSAGVRGAGARSVGLLHRYLAVTREFHVFDAVLSFSGARRTTPVGALIDDLKWADAASVAARVPCSACQHSRPVVALSGGRARRADSPPTRQVASWLSRPLTSFWAPRQRTHPALRDRSAPRRPCRGRALVRTHGWQSVLRHRVGPYSSPAESLACNAAIDHASSTGISSAPC